MPEDAAWRTRPLITRLVKTWIDIVVAGSHNGYH